LTTRQVIDVAIRGDGYAMHELHDEKRAPAVGCAGVKDLGNILVVHHGQGLPLGLETGDDLGAVHARLDDLESDPTMDRLVLLGHVDDAEAAFAELLEELVQPDVSGGALPSRSPPSCGLWGPHTRPRRVH